MFVVSVHLSAAELRALPGESAGARPSLHLRCSWCATPTSLGNECCRDGASSSHRRACYLAVLQPRTEDRRRHTKRKVKRTVYTLLTLHFPQPRPFQGSKANFGRATAGGGAQITARGGQSCHELLKETVEEWEEPAGRTHGSAECAPRDQCAALTPHIEDRRQHEQRQG